MIPKPMNPIFILFLLPAVYNRSQLGKNCFFVRGSKDPDTHFAVAEIQHCRKASNAVPQSEIRIPIEFDRGELQILDKLSINFVHRSVEHDRRKTPSGGELDQHGLAGFQNFGFEVCFIDFNDRSHVDGVFCDNLTGRLSCDQVAFGRLEKADQFRQAPLVGVAGGTITVGSDPIGVLDAQVFVNLLLKLAVRMNLVRHDNFLDEGLSQIAFRFNCSGYDLLSPRRYCACVGFCVTTREVMDAPSYGGAQNSYEYG